MNKKSRFITSAVVALGLLMPMSNSSAAIGDDIFNATRPFFQSIIEGVLFLGEKAYESQETINQKAKEISDAVDTVMGIGPPPWSMTVELAGFAPFDVQIGEQNINTVKHFLIAKEISNNWTATQMTAGGGYLYWTDGDNILRQGRVQDGHIVDIIHLTDNWTATQFTVDGDYLYWTDGDNILRQGRVENGSFVDVIHLTDNWTATQFSAGGGYLYWTDGDNILRQGYIENGQIAGVQHLTNNWTATHLAAGNNCLFWTDGDRLLRRADVQNGQIHNIEYPSSNWIATQVANDDVFLYWTDGDRRLRIAAVLSR